MVLGTVNDYVGIALYITRAISLWKPGVNFYDLNENVPHRFMFEYLIPSSLALFGKAN